MTGFQNTGKLGRPLIIGHRGASCCAPENTFPAFEAAEAVGADGVELDVHLTSDGVPVVIHNAQVDATCDGSGLVNDLTLEQVRRLDAGIRFRPEFTATRIPTLDEVLATFGERLLLNIELKPQVRPASRSRLEATVADLIRVHRLEERVWVSSFKPYSLHRMHQIAPEIDCGFLYSPLTLGAVWLMPFTPFKALHPHTSLTSKLVVYAAHLLGRRVVSWTVDDPVAAVRQSQWGVDALITNDPGALLALISAGI